MENVEDIYPLSPLQSLMLLDARSPAGEGTRFDQLGFTMRGAVGAEDLRSALETVTARHTALRSAFFWEGLREPVQIVRKSVQVPFEFFDMTVKSAEESAAAIADFAAEDRSRGFDLTTPPPVRMAFFQLKADQARVIMSYLPCMLDGWSTALIIREMLAVYEARLSNRSADLGPAPAYRDYIAWLQARNIDNAEAYWREALRGLQRPTPLPVDRLAAPAIDVATPPSLETQLSEADIQTLRSYAKRHRVTMNSLIQTAWAMLLSVLSGERKVAFLTAVSGRPSDLDHVDAIAGVFFNNVPLCIDLENTACGSLAGQVQRQIGAAARYDYASPAQIQSWSAMDAGAPLCHSLVLFHNFPLAGTFWETDRAFSISDLDKPIRTNLPLTLICVPELGFKFQLIYNGALWEEGSAQKILDLFVHVLKRLSVSGDAPVADVLSDIPSLSLSHMMSGHIAQEIIRNTEYSAAENQGEALIIQVWEAVLGVTDIGANDNLFDLGGRSMHVAQIRDRLTEAGFKLSVIDMFEYPTVRQLARHLEGGAAENVPSVSEDVRDASVAARKRRSARMKKARAE